MARSLEGAIHCWVCGQILPYAGTGRRRRVHDGSCKRENSALLAVRNRTTRQVSHRNWRSVNKTKIAAWNKRWNQAHPEGHRARAMQRKMKLREAMDRLDRELSAAYRKAIEFDPCYYCGSSEVHHVDHYVSLANGGTDHWWNLVRACSTCNWRKGRLNGDEFIQLIWVPA